MFQALLCAILVFIGECDTGQTLSQIGRPIIMGPLIGLILGDVKTGLMVGVAVETMFLANVHVGMAVPPDAIYAGALATVLAIAAGGNVAVGIATALPMSIVGQMIFHLRAALTEQFTAIEFEKSCLEGNIKAMIFWKSAVPFFIRLILYGAPVFLVVYVSGSFVAGLVEAFPEKLISGISAGSGLVAAVGLSMLLKSIDTKGLWPFLLLGFICSAFLGMNMVGIAMVALIVIAIMFYNQKDHMPVTQTQAAGAAANDMIIDDED